MRGQGHGTNLKAWLCQGDGGNLFAEPQSLLREQRLQKQNWTDAANWAGHHANFLECVKTRRRPIAPAEIAHRSTSLCHAANICLRLGRRLTWDPTTETFPDDPQASRMLSRPMRSPWQI